MYTMIASHLQLSLFFCRFSIFFFSISRSEDGIFGSRGYSYIQNRINNVYFSCIYVYACTCPCVHVSVCTIIVSALYTKKSSCKRSWLLKCHLLFTFSFFFLFIQTRYDDWRTIKYIPLSSRGENQGFTRR